MNKLDISFEPATEEDKAYFQALGRACYEDVVTRQFGQWDEVLQRQNFEVKWPEHNFRKIMVDDVLVGGVWTDDFADYVQLREIQIHPDFQGQGIGAAIVQMEIDQTRKMDKRLRLRVLFENKAINLYRRLGFTVIDQNEHQHIMECV